MWMLSFRVNVQYTRAGDDQGIFPCKGRGLCGDWLKRCKEVREVLVLGYDEVKMHVMWCRILSTYQAECPNICQAPPAPSPRAPLPPFPPLIQLRRGGRAHLSRGACAAHVARDAWHADTVRHGDRHSGFQPHGVPFRHSEWMEVSICHDPCARGCGASVYAAHIWESQVKGAVGWWWWWWWRWCLEWWWRLRGGWSRLCDDIIERDVWEHLTVVWIGAAENLQ